MITHYRLLFAVIIFLTLSLTGCVVNPVTGKSELSLVSPAQEVEIGKKQYAPSRQMQGGDYAIDPALSAYVNSVGQKIAAVSDRPGLPYEFVVLNNSVPNAWALPGGKIAINRGLLTELGSEAELAAVLSHEIVHAAARHGAQSMQRSMLYEAAVVGIAATTQDNQYSNLIVGSSQLGASLLTQSYSRDAELEADRFGMDYMVRAGYNPAAAVDLQETFVRLSEGQNQDWLTGLFASHPPSRKRVEENRAYAQQLGTDGMIGEEEYQTQLASLKELTPGYEKYDKAVLAFNKLDLNSADMLTRSALAIIPGEAKFYSLLGDIEFARGNYTHAEDRYDQSISRNPNYFQSFLGRGLANQKLGNLKQARKDFEVSIKLLPTATAYYGLGEIAETNEEAGQAIENYRLAATAANQSVGQKAQQRIAHLEMADFPDRYISSQVTLDSKQRPLVVLKNVSPVDANNITIELQQLDAAQRRIVSRRQYQVTGTLAAGSTKRLSTGMGALTDSIDVNQLRVSVVTATPETQP